MNQAMNRHRARSQFIEPMWSMPEEILSALLLQRQERNTDDASLSFSEQWYITKRRLGALKNSLPKLYDGRGGISAGCLVDWDVSPLKFHTVFWRERRAKCRNSETYQKHQRNFGHLFKSIHYPCSMCCCKTTRPGPRKRRKTGRKSPRPEQWYNRSSAESWSPGCHNQDLHKWHFRS